MCLSKRDSVKHNGDNRDSLLYFIWKTVQEDKIVRDEKKTFKITKKVPISSSVKELKITLFEVIRAMKKHLYGIYSYNKLKKELKDNLRESEIMIQIDFSENYTMKYTNEIQSTHFAKKPLSIHTRVYYSRNGNGDLKLKSFATVSENLDHQAHAVWAHMKPILITILENKHIDTLHIYSDGPTSQYRNRTNVTLWIQTLINHFQQVTKSSWTFSESGHSKGPMDGIGGYLKITADRHVLLGNDIRNASEFVYLFKESSIEVTVISEEDVIEERNRVPNPLDAILGIMDITKIFWQKELEVSIQLYRYEQFHKELKLSKLLAFLIKSINKKVSSDDTSKKPKIRYQKSEKIEFHKDRNQNTHLHFKTGFTYDGRLLETNLHGKGVLHSNTGLLYRGNFFNSFLKGNGIINWPNGSWYQGNFEYGMRNGYGTYVPAKKEDPLYSGNWINGKRHGFGQTDRNNDFNTVEMKYYGYWSNNKMHGWGSAQWSNGTQYGGQWKNSKPDGEGTAVWSDNDV
ncbi:uncharacterized protein LOC126898325 [Daktulosphaira vitifoliae]|uniref:uncharacterized protein LOC126898325 n=1 Tax=Daktulosphaira vitifoliae TaxID=58002 RepID=UPI0021A97D08|nr:uncharacterized protein LOC126898325 [Daktulosphaira vitifoliae]